MGPARVIGGTALARMGYLSRRLTRWRSIP